MVTGERHPVFVSLDVFQMGSRRVRDIASLCSQVRDNLFMFPSVCVLNGPRWILLCFKREFNEKDALRIWETCWAHYQTDYFHLFLCVAIVAIYGDDVVDQRLPADDILLHFSSLAMHMNGDIVLRKVGRCMCLLGKERGHRAEKGGQVHVFARKRTGTSC